MCYTLHHMRLEFLHPSWQLSPKLFFSFVFLSAILSGFAFAPSASAATCYFASIGTDDFNTAGNWDCGFVPGSGDSAVITSATTTVLSAPVTVSDVTIQSGSTLTTTGIDLTVENSLLSLGGTLVAGMGNTITVGDDFAFNIPGSVFVPGDGTILFSAASPFGGHDITSPVGGMTFHNIVANSQRGVFFDTSATFTVTGNVSSTSVINVGSGTSVTQLSVAGDATFNNGSYLFVNGASSTFSVQGITTNNAGAIFRPINGSVTFDGPVNNSGFLRFDPGDTGTLYVNNSWANAGVFTAGSSTVVFGGGLAQMVPAVTFNDLTIQKTGSSVASLSGNVTASGTVALVSGQLSAGSADLSIYGDFIGSSGTFDPGTGTVFFEGGLDQHLGVSGVFAPSFYNANVLKSAGTLTVEDIGLTLNQLALYSGALDAGSAVLVMRGGAVPFLPNGGSFVPSSSTFIYDAPGGATVASTTFYKLSFNPGGVNSIYGLSGSTTVMGDLLIGGTTSTLNLMGNTLHVGGNWTNNGFLVPAGGQVSLVGSGFQSVSAEPNFDTLSIDKTGGSANLIGDIGANRLLLNAGALNAGTATISFATGTWAAPFAFAGGVFEPGAGTVRFSKNIDTSFGNGLFYNLVLEGAGHDHEISGSSTVLGLLTVTSTASLTLGNATLTVPGTIQNMGLVTVDVANGGGYVHRPESLSFTDAGFVASTSFTLPTDLWFSIQDGNRNLDGSVAESFTVTITNAAGDSETRTMLETGPATGIFHSTAALASAKQTPATPNDNVLAMPSTGFGVLNYTDPSDATDATTASATLTAPAGSGNNNGGGGGGGGGGGSGLAPTTAVFMTTAVDQALLTKLKELGISVHALVKSSDASAVYYIGADGKRHAFPNDKAFFTWYCDFTGVQTVSADKIAQIPLGSNVTYRPGYRMVKFATDPKVYLVTLGGVLRHVATEEVARSLFGSFWNTYIDDVSDAFYVNYTFGSAISDAKDMNLTALVNSVSYPSESLNIPGVNPVPGQKMICSSIDRDADGLSDDEERRIGTNPMDADTDHDGFSDAVEVQTGHDPLKP